MNEADDRDPTDKSFEEVEGLFGDLFSDLFGQGAREGGGRGADIRLELSVSLAEATEGGQRELTYPRLEGCGRCDGHGAAPEHRQKCGTCEGHGMVSESRGALQRSRPCDSCQGTGTAHSLACAACDGLGGGTRQAKVRVTIPSGVRNGQTLRLVGMGSSPLRGREPGHLYIVIDVETDPRFARENDDLFTLAHVPRALAEAGGSVEVSLPSGSTKLAVPKGTKTGDNKRWRGYGARRLGAPAAPRSSGDEPYRSVDASASRGDLIVCFVVEGEPVPAQAALRLKGDGRPGTSHAGATVRSDSLSPRFIVTTLLLTFAVIALIAWTRA